MSGLAAQLVIEVLLVALVYRGIRAYRGGSFATAAGLKFPFKGLWYCILGGPILAMGVSLVASLLRTPQIPSALDQLQNASVPIPVIAIFAVILGPLFEELMFRGFLQPFAGIVITSTLFSLLHGAQNQWLWQYLVLMFLVSLVFGLARHRAGSTVASLLLHMGFNLTALLATINSR